MAGNPLQQMIPQVLQQLMQNPQMLQQIMQQAGPLLQMAGLQGQAGYQADPSRMNLDRWEEKYQPGESMWSGMYKTNPVPLPRILGSGEGNPIYDVDNPRSEKQHLRELFGDFIGPDYMPKPQGLTPELWRYLQEVNPPPVEDTEDMYPGMKEPVSQLQPGLLTRLAALSMPSQIMPQSKGYPITKDDIDLAQGDYMPDAPMDEEEEEEEEQEKNYKGGRG